MKSLSADIHLLIATSLGMKNNLPMKISIIQLNLLWQMMINQKQNDLTVYVLNTIESLNFYICDKFCE